MRGRTLHPYENLYVEPSEKHMAPSYGTEPLYNSSTLLNPPPAAHIPSPNIDARRSSGYTHPSGASSPAWHSAVSSSSSSSSSTRVPHPSAGIPRTASLTADESGSQSSGQKNRYTLDHSLALREKVKAHSAGSASSRGTSRDLEKGSSLDNHSHRDRRTSHAPTHHTTLYYPDPDEADPMEEAKNHAVWILIYLSALAPLLSFALALYALIATALIVLSFPLCKCITRVPLSKHFRRFLIPPLTLQLSLIYSVADNDDDGAAPESQNQNSPLLVIVNLLAPLYATGIMIAAWVAAGFWFFGAILGDPNPKEEKDNDGRTTVLYVRNWWEKWLRRGL